MKRRGQHLWTRQAMWLFAITIAFVAALAGCECDSNPPLGEPGKIATDQNGDTVLFENVQVDKEQKKTFLLFNDGAREITISAMEIVDNAGGVFKLTNPPEAGTTLAGGKENGIKVTVAFLPTKVDVFEARIKISSPDADNVDENGDFYVKLRHLNLSPDPVFSCGGTINFGSVEKGKTLTKECVIRNRGNADLVINGATYKKDKGGTKQDFTWDTKFPITIKADDTKGVTVKVTYAPSDYPPREDQGTFVLDTNIRDDGTDNSPRLKVVGLTAVALIELVPLYSPCKTDTDCRRIDARLRCSKDEFSGQNLCLQAPNTTPVLKFPLTSQGKTTKRIFAIRSIGDKPLTIDGIAFTSQSSTDFKVITQGVSFPLTLDPKQTKEITVEYQPSDKTEDKGTIEVTSNAGNNPKAPVLVEAAARGCNLDVLPRKIEFGGPTSEQVTIVNKGNESCVLSKVYMKSGKNEPFSFLPAPKADLTLLPNGTFSFLATFNPKDKTKVTDFIVVESSDPDEPTIEVELTGQPVGPRPCALEAQPGSLNFGLVPVGRSLKSSLTIVNKGYGTCELSSLNVLGTNPSNNNAFQLTSSVRTPLQIKSQASIRLDVSYTPPQERSGYEGILEIKSNDKDQPNFQVKLVGSSGTLCLEIVPPNMDFGSTKFGCATPKRLIEVFNLGSSKCSSSISVTKIEIVNDKDNEFRINSAPTTPRTLTAGQSIRIELSYKAKDLGVDTATLNIGNSVAGQSPIPVPLVGEGVSTSDQKDVFKQLKRPLTDIAFVVDDSGSMGEEQASLAKNFQSFMNWAVRLNVDYHIMVTTTDLKKSGAKAPGCARGTTKIVTPQTPNPTATFAQNVNVGTSGDAAQEAGLEAAYRALIPPASTGCNNGFYRKDASLSLVFVSDEPDQSRQTVQFYVSFFKALKGIRNLDLIRASAVVGPPPSGCRNPGTGNASSAPRYWEVAKQLKGVKESICSSNWSATLSNLGSITFGYRTQFFLSRQADPKTIKVKVNGAPVKEDPQDGWTYDSANNSVNFTKSQIPPPGATVQVEYKAICLP